MYVFIKFHITAQSGSVILVVLCQSRWFSLGGSMIHITKTSDQTRQMRYTLYLYSSFFSPECLALPSLLPYYSLNYLIQYFLDCVFFSFRPSLPRFPHHTYNTFGFLALLRVFSILHDPVSRLSSLGPGLQHNATVSLERRVLRLWLPVTRWRRPPFCVFRPTSITMS